MASPHRTVLRAAGMRADGRSVTWRRSELIDKPCVGGGEYLSELKIQMHIRLYHLPNAC